METMIKRRDFLKTSLLGATGVGILSGEAFGKFQSKDGRFNPKPVSKLSSPRPKPNGLAWDGENIWVGHDGSDPAIFEMNPEGRIQHSFGNGIRVTGLTWGDDALYYSNFTNIFKVPFEDGKPTATRKFQSPVSNEDYNFPTGLTWDGNSIWMTHTRGSQIYQLDANMNQVYSISLPGNDGTTGPAFDGESLWVVVYFTENEPGGKDWSAALYKYSTNGELLAEFSLPTWYASLMGGTWMDSHLLLSTPGHDIITKYQVNLPPAAAFEHEPSTPEVGRQVDFRSTSRGRSATITDVRWQIGNTVTKTGTSITHTFSSAGTYQVRLIVTDSTGLSASVSKEIHVDELSTPAGNGQEGDTNPQKTSASEAPGFGTVGAIGGLSGAGYILKRRFERSRTE